MSFGLLMIWNWEFLRWAVELLTVCWWANFETLLMSLCISFPDVTVLHFIWIKGTYVLVCIMRTDCIGYNLQHKAVTNLLGQIGTRATQPQLTNLLTSSRDECNCKNKYSGLNSLHVTTPNKQLLHIDWLQRIRTMSSWISNSSRII